ncbi:protoglobin domain-containing protein [Roseibium sp.]|uniref:protoglobin domain-containing protein n=1 Tax=Roseibium sp. TaxID=1936156 RepID=UPI003A981CD3
MNTYSNGDFCTNRLDFIGLTPSHIASLVKNRERLLDLIPSILERFYDHIAQFPETKKFFRDTKHMAHARDAQTRHWDLILEGTFDDVYFESVTRIGNVHNKLGLEPRWYIGAYNFLMCGLCDALADKRSGFGMRTVSSNLLQEAVMKAAMLDMDLALSVYQEAGQNDRRDLIQSLSTKFEETVGHTAAGLSQATLELQEASARLSGATERTESQTARVCENSTVANQNVQAVSAAVEELSTSVQEIGRQVHDSHSVSDQAVDQSDAAMTAVSSLTETVNKVDEIVNLINAIAEKTNLLALNATIEAARAGEAGKGFAVVASEVKDLAGQTAKATSEISAQIAGIEQATERSATAIENVTGTISRMNEISTSIAAAVEEQGKATGEISRSIQEAARGASVVDDCVQGISQASRDVGDVASTVAVSSGQLGKNVTDLETTLKSFMAELSAAAG